MKKKYLQVVLGLSLAALSGVAAAQFGGLTSALSGSTGGASGVSAESLVKSYVGGTKNVMTADASLLKAVGLKDEGSRSELAAQNLTEGATSASLEDAVKIQTESSKLLAEKFSDKSTVVDADSKKEYTKGLLSLALGLKDYAGMSGDLKNFKPSVTSLGGAAGAAMYVVKTLPDSTSNLLSTLKKAVEFAREKKIEVPKEATSLL